MMQDFLSYTLTGLSLAAVATDADPAVQFWLRRLSAYHDACPSGEGRDAIDVLGNTHGLSMKRENRDFFFCLVDEYEAYKLGYNLAVDNAEADAKRALIKAKIAALPPTPPGFPSFQFAQAVTTPEPTRELPPIALEYNYSADAALVCPLCKGAHLHQEEVAVYQRTGEDEEDGVCVSVHAAEACVSLDMEHNPSFRRDGLLITFRCEGCSEEDGKYPQLAVFQHKGTTYLKWQRVFTQRN